MLTAKEVAEYFISTVDLELQDFLTNLKIQKLLYYSQGYALGSWSAPLFPEKIIAWQLGPVVMEVYKEYEKYGASPVPLPSDFDVSKYDSSTKGLLDKVHGEYGHFSASELVDMTHEESPWIMTKINREITVRHMQDFFSKKLK